MKALAITHKGFEDISASEIKGITNSKTTIADTCVLFEPKEYEDLCLLCYKAQSVIKIIYLLDSFKIKNIEDIRKHIPKCDDFLDKDTTFAVRSYKFENDDYPSAELERLTGEYLLDSLDFKPKVNLEDPDVSFFVYLCKDTCYLGIDFSGKDLSKRQYKIFSGFSSVKGSIAFSLLKLADISDKDTILDPFCYTGTIPIEAALYLSKYPVNFFNKDDFAFTKLKPLASIDFDKFFSSIDKKIKKPNKPIIHGFENILRNIMFSKKNAKIAGIEKFINFSRVDVEWLDTKLDKGQVTRVVSRPPIVSKQITKKEIEKTYDELFYQLNFVLDNNGKIILLAKKTELLEEAAKKHGFHLSEKRDVKVGKEDSYVVVFIKQKA